MGDIGPRNVKRPARAMDLSSSPTPDSSEDYFTYTTALPIPVATFISPASSPLSDSRLGKLPDLSRSSCQERPSKRHCPGPVSATPPRFSSYYVFSTKNTAALGDLLSSPSNVPNEVQSANTCLPPRKQLSGPPATRRAPLPLHRLARPPTRGLFKMMATDDYCRWFQRCQDLYSEEDYGDDLYRGDNNDEYFHGGDLYEDDEYFHYDNAHRYNSSDNPLVLYTKPVVPTLGVPDIPWPTRPSAPSKWGMSNGMELNNVTRRNVVMFITSFAESTGKDVREVVSNALWHFDPDRFDDIVLPRVFPDDRKCVQDGVVKVWRILSDILAHPKITELSLLEANVGDRRLWSATLFASSNSPRCPPS
ncbi:hypothetical protein CC85DRAFT_303044 [Cutaneotrichosporon oleaginosum]|uniref:Uncharacterized protein n=1 Tax=Cutaneotrichosporon oleaginosum TaxID=879819 RepID=A0A0J0XKI9_9TREE|nr:uncharacterized protein CC85DRAFT_303044 [Cutaneotrichosporon oleaginosum]KLT41600.1 hypothetical protein CC85DRAFT_303044 [Cutaneotrichosporon oleaginosum]TXT08161.1 hypothetical protein COLE_05085 [Cutaneotrichosporon oleaginosum]